MVDLHHRSRSHISATWVILYYGSPLTVAWLLSGVVSFRRPAVGWILECRVWLCPAAYTNKKNRPGDWRFLNWVFESCLRRKCPPCLWLWRSSATVASIFSVYAISTRVVGFSTDCFVASRIFWSAKRKICLDIPLIYWEDHYVFYTARILHVMARNHWTYCLSLIHIWRCRRRG